VGGTVSVRTDLTIEILEQLSGIPRALLERMSTKQRPPDPSNVKPTTKVDPKHPHPHPPTTPVTPPVDPQPWKKDRDQMPADLRPTAEEYERDAILEKEDQDKADEKARLAYEASKAGTLPPAAQTLEEARAAREKAEKKAKEDSAKR